MAQTERLYNAALFRGLQLADELAAFRAKTASEVQQYRYQDMAFRIARNDALQKYGAQFDLAARYAYLAATAYDYETNLLGTSGGAGRDFLTEIVRHRSLGEVLNGEPVVGSNGLADPMARMALNFEVLKGQMGFNNPQTETNRFSLRKEALRKYAHDLNGDGRSDPEEIVTDAEWKSELEKYWVDLWDIPQWRRYARPFAAEPPQPVCSDATAKCFREPALVIGWTGNGGQNIATTVTAGLNFFAWPLGSGDSNYSASHFATKIRSVGVWFENYSDANLAQTPRVYLLPVGADFLRPPTSGDFRTRQWQVVDQVIPVPFPIGATALDDPEWIPLNDTLNGGLGDIRRIGDFRAHNIEPGATDFDLNEFETDSRLIGRSVWNNQWLLVIPGRALLADGDEGIRRFLENVTDVKIFFQTYAYTGNRDELP